MIVSHRHQFIFLKTKKVASTSVEIALSGLCGPDDIITPIAEEHLRERKAQNYALPFRERPWAGKWRTLVGARVTARRSGFYHHMPAALARDYLGRDIFDRYFKFTIERNPWDRQVSHYYWQTRRDTPRPDFSDYIDRPRKEKRIDNFDIYSIDGEIVADHVMRYEDLDAEFERACRRFGLDKAPPLPRAKADHREGADYRKHYTGAAQDIVAQWYEREIDAFGYAF